jgi:hypothetical protein
MLIIPGSPKPRAYLMSSDFDNPIDNDQQLYDRGEKLYLQRNYMGMLSNIYINSPRKAMKKLYTDVTENIEEQTYSYDAGYQPRFMLDKILAGNEISYGPFI